MATNATAHVPDTGALQENGAYTTSDLGVASRDLSPSRENVRRAASDPLMHRVKGTSTSYTGLFRVVLTPNCVVSNPWVMKILYISTYLRQISRVTRLTKKIIHTTKLTRGYSLCHLASP